MRSFWEIYNEDDGETNRRSPASFAEGPRHVPDQSARDSYFAKVLEGAISDVASAEIGRRNDTLNRTAYSAYRKAQSCLHPLETVTEALTVAAKRTGLPDAEVARTLRSARTSAYEQGRWNIDWSPYNGASAATIASGSLSSSYASGITANEVGYKEDQIPLLCSEIITRSALKKLPKAEPLIDNVLDQGTVALLYGKWGSGKSFIALDWAASVATGRPWQARATQQRRVLYVAAEGAYGLRARMDAWEQGWRTEVADGQLDVLARPLNLTRSSEISDLRVLIACQGYGLVVIDTLARCMVGADENSAKDCGQVVDALHRLRESTPEGRGVITAVHHTGKDGKTFRGSSAFEAGADTVYSVALDGRSITLKREKRKDGPENDQHALQLDSVKSASSCVVSIRRGADSSGTAGKLMSVFLSTFDTRGCSQAELRAVASEAGIASSSFHRGLTELLKTGQLINTGTEKRRFLQRCDL